MEAIQELTSDVEDVYKNICQQASNHIHSGEIILTYGRSGTVDQFLKAAAGVDGNKNSSGGSSNSSGDPKLRFSVIVVDSGEDGTGGGQDLASSLASIGIDTCIVPVASVFAIMARVNKVILPAYSVLANGGLVAPSGSNLVVLAAQANAVPVVVLTGIFKLTPLFPHEQQNTLNDLLSPCSTIDYIAYQRGPAMMNSDKATSSSSSSQEKGNSLVDLVNPMHDYVQPQLVNLYVTNVGSFQPSYIYRLLAEYYHSDDWGQF
jgi:translation initiation factor eIF-2B subunit beta